MLDPVASMSFSDAGTKVGHLSPWETCKAFAFHTALQAIEKTLQKRSCDFLGERVNIWIGKQLQVKGGGCPSEGAPVMHTSVQATTHNTKLRYMSPSYYT